MIQFTMATLGYLLIGLLGATGLVLSLATLSKETQHGYRITRIFSKGIVWSALTLVGLCAIVLSANPVETVRALETVSSHVQAAMRGYY